MNVLKEKLPSFKEIQFTNRTEMIYLADQVKMRRKTLTQIHTHNPCSTAGCKGTGKGLRVKQPLRRIEAKALQTVVPIFVEYWGG